MLKVVKTMEENYISFRKAKVGGFNKKDVIAYIEKMRNDFFDYKKAVENTIDQLNAKVRELEAACEGHREQIKEVIVEVPVAVENNNDPISDINEATSKLRLVADELCRNLSEFMAKISSGENTAARADEKPEIFDNVSAYIEETAKEIFEESGDEPVCESEEKAAPVDKVSDILNSSLNFSFSKEENESVEPKTVETKKDKTILDTLSEYSFIG